MKFYAISRALLVALSLPLALAGCISSKFEESVVKAKLSDDSTFEVATVRIHSGDTTPSQTLAAPFRCKGAGDNIDCQQIGEVQGAVGPGVLNGVVAPIGSSASFGAIGAALLRPTRISTNDNRSTNVTTKSEGSNAVADSKPNVDVVAKGGEANPNIVANGGNAQSDQSQTASSDQRQIAKGGDGGQGGQGGFSNANSSPFVSNTALSNPTQIGGGANASSNQTQIGGGATAFGGSSDATASPVTSAYGGTSISDADAGATAGALSTSASFSNAASFNTNNIDITVPVSGGTSCKGRCSPN